MERPENYISSPFEVIMVSAHAFTKSTGIFDEVVEFNRFVQMRWIEIHTFQLGDNDPTPACCKRDPSGSTEFQE